MSVRGAAAMSASEPVPASSSSTASWRRRRKKEKKKARRRGGGGRQAERRWVGALAFSGERARGPLNAAPRPPSLKAAANAPPRPRAQKQQRAHTRQCAHCGVKSALEPLSATHLQRRRLARRLWRLELAAQLGHRWQALLWRHRHQQRTVLIVHRRGHGENKPPGRRGRTALPGVRKLFLFCFVLFCFVLF